MSGGISTLIRCFSGVDGVPIFSSHLHSPMGFFASSSGVTATRYALNKPKKPDQSDRRSLSVPSAGTRNTYCGCIRTIRKPESPPHLSSGNCRGWF